MRRLLPALLLCGCAGSLVDHDGVALSPAGDGGVQCTQPSDCKNTPPGATALCDNSTCSFKCPAGQFKLAASCSPANEISAGANHTCAIVAGEARCWGANDSGQLGRDGLSSSVPSKVPLTGPVTHVAAGSAHGCAIVGGTVSCWGDNTYGQLGNGTTNPTTPLGAPQPVTGISGVLQIAAGGSHTCAASATTTWCWGNDDRGQIGDGSAVGGTRAGPVEIVQAAGATALAAGDGHSCALVGSSVLCWGANDVGQVGNSAFGSPVTTPAAISGFSATILASGANHVCAISTDSLSCWGANASGQIDSSLQNQNKPRGTLSNIRAVAAGGAHTCALTNDPALRCRGLNDQQQLGGAGPGEVTVPLTGVTIVSAGGQHTCAIANGDTYCWGLNDRGQLGSSAASPAPPTLVSGL